MNFIDISKDKKGTYKVNKPGKHIFFIHNYSGNVHIDIKTRNAEVYIFGAYIGTGNDQFKLNTTQHHHVGNSVSDLLIKGVFFDTSKFTYEGLIRIDKDAQQSNAYQKNQNLVMSDKVFIDSRPFLEILANDVRCTHGSTTGRLDDDQIFYAQSRGLSLKKSKHMLIEGFIADIFGKIERLGVKNNIKNLTRLLNKIL